MFSIIPSRNADFIEKNRYRIDFLSHKKYVKSIKHVTLTFQFSLTEKRRSCLFCKRNVLITLTPYLLFSYGAVIGATAPYCCKYVSTCVCSFTR
ncbi:hypothetical protein FPS98_03330 [Brevibacillus brevis]|uniref:Uncharacterized protein n=1 Tax=Brevibacillus brevis TaxID=1393 RepID=A0A517I2K5_BREBE|nr:hypothetical protein FPS98_03330 [Brevibacillus brevis]